MLAATGLAVGLAACDGDEAKPPLQYDYLFELDGRFVGPDVTSEERWIFPSSQMFSASNTGPYAWLNKVLAVGVGKYLNMAEGRVVYDVYRI